MLTSNHQQPKVSPKQWVGGENGEDSKRAFEQLHRSLYGST